MRKERTVITQELCDHVRILLAGGANLNKAAEITKTGHATISRIKAAGFSAEEYRKQQTERKQKETPKPVLTIRHEELLDPDGKVPGQIEMDLTTAAKPEISEQTKLMRFQAEMTTKQIKAMEAAIDRICEKITAQAVIINETLMVKLDKLNDTMSMLLRAVRKE